MAIKDMATDSDAPTSQPGAPSEDDYRSFCAALESSARGRAFLTEFARRNRHADTEMLLGAIDRLETLMRAEGTALERLRDELRLLLIAIRLGRPDIDAASPQTKAAKLAGLLDMLERRLDAMADNKPAEAAPADDAPPPAAAALMIVPQSDEPELPIPSPAAQPPAFALVREVDPEAPELDSPWEPVFEMDAAVANNAPEQWLPDFGGDPDRIIHSQPLRTVAFMPEVAFIGGAAPEPAIAEVAAAEPPAPIAIAAPVEIAPPITIEPAPKPAVILPPANPLAAILALSEEERIALFT